MEGTINRTGQGMPFSRFGTAQKFGARFGTLILMALQLSGHLAVANAAAPPAPYSSDLLTAGNGYASQPWLAGWIGGTELTLLRPFHTMGTTGVEGTDFSFGPQSSPRFWLGYSTAGGIGVRARYWNFDH